MVTNIVYMAEVPRLPLKKNYILRVVEVKNFDKKTMTSSELFGPFVNLANVRHLVRSNYIKHIVHLPR